MYIPSPPRDPAHDPSSVAATEAGRRSGHRTSPSHSTAAGQPPFRSLPHLDVAFTDPNPAPRTIAPIASLFGRLAFPAESRLSTIRKRGSSYQTTNITIGIVIAILLTAFLVAVFLFCHRYRPTIRFSRRKKRHRRKSAGSKSSKASSDGGTAPADAAPAPAG